MELEPIGGPGIISTPHAFLEVGAADVPFQQENRQGALRNRKAGVNVRIACSLIAGIVGVDQYAPTAGPVTLREREAHGLTVSIDREERALPR
jgi:hypothetical protein